MSDLQRTISNIIIPFGTGKPHERYFAKLSLAGGHVHVRSVMFPKNLKEERRDRSIDRRKIECNLYPEPKVKHFATYKRPGFSNDLFIVVVPST